MLNKEVWSLLTEQEKLVIVMRSGGATFAKIGKATGLCTWRANEIYKNALEFARMCEEDPFKNVIFQNTDRHIGKLIVHALFLNGINSIDKLDAMSMDELRRTRHIGEKTFEGLEKIKAQIVKEGLASKHK